MVYIYRLRDALRDAVFYVGCTTNINMRFDNHIDRSLNDTRDYRLKELWIKHIVLVDESQPVIEVIEECADAAGSSKEMLAITNHLWKGDPLTNVSFKGIEEHGIELGYARSLAKANRKAWARKHPDFPLSHQIINGRNG